MELNLDTLGPTLNDYVSNNKVSDAELYLTKLNTLLKEELTPALLDLYIINIFNKESGLLVFISNVSGKPAFRKAIITSLEILYTIVNNFPYKIKKYIENLSELSLRLVRSNAGAFEKEKALLILILIIENPDLYLDSCAQAYESLFKHFNCGLEKSSTVRNKLTKALGTIAKNFSQVINNEKNLFDMFINQLKKEIVTNEYSPIVTATFEAITDFLDSFQNEEYKVILNEKVFPLIKKLSTPSNNSVSRRAALKLLSTHTSLFSEKLFAEYKFWHNQLNTWINSSTAVDNKKTGYVVLTAFYQEMANVIKTEKKSEHKQALFYFLSFFKKNEMELENHHKRHLAIKGYGIFAEACCIHLSSEEITRMFVAIIQNVEQMYNIDSEIDGKHLECLPFYIETIAKLIPQFKLVTNYHLQCLQMVIILIIKSFPNFSQLHHGVIAESFLSTVYCLYRCDNKTLDNFLNTVIYQGIIWTCSHTLVTDVELMKEENEMKDALTYKNYLPFWIGLFKTLDKLKINFDDKMILMTKLFDELTTTLFILIRKLNLNLKKKQEEVFFTDPEIMLEAVKKHDFAMFINIVDFYCDLFEIIDKKIFKKWIILFNKEIIRKSLKHPLVSGFYKLLASSLKICNNLDYFDKKRLLKEDVKMCFESLRKFICDLLWKMKQYKDDLLMSCLQLLLNAPICLIQDLLPKCVPAFITLFSMSKSDYKLIDTGINTLEHWLNNMPYKEVRQFLKDVIPPLDSFLRSKSIGGLVESKSVVKTRKTNQILKKRKVLIETEPELFKLQRKIIMFIGQLDSDLCYTFVNSGNNIEPVIWKKNCHLKIDLKFEDLTLQLYLDKFIIRIIDLVLNCSDRKTRITACESLHSIIMFLLGAVKQMDASTSVELDGIFKKIAFPLLQLGCDMDVVVQQLFYPLLLQLMHWYSSPYQIRSTHTVIFIDALMQGVTHSTNSSVRDLSAKCIKEFVTWSIKQTELSKLENDHINIKAIIDKIISFSQHPDANIRLGAALIFNNIYTELREEECLVNIFWLELLDSFVINISHIKTNNTDNNNCLLQVKQALNHLQRVFIEKSALFNRNSKKRRIPASFDGGLLKDVALFLLEKTASLSQYCRENFEEMLCKIAPRVTNCNSLTEFLKQNADIEHIFEAYETELKQVFILRNLENTEKLFRWFDYLLCVLDGYKFISKNNLLPTKYISSDTTFHKCLTHFLVSIQLQNLQGNVTVTEKEYYDFCKTKIIIELLNFLTILIENCELALKFPYAFWNNSISNLIVNVLFQPTKLGFDMNSDQNEIEIAVNLLNSFEKKGTITQKDYIKTTITAYIKNNLKLFQLNAQTVPLDQRFLLKGILSLEKSSLSKLLNLQVFCEGIKKMYTVLLENNACKLEESTTYEYCDLYLQLSLLNKKELPILIECLYNQTEITNYETSKIQFGKYFLEKFKDILINYLIDNMNECCDLIFNNYSNMTVTINFFITIFKHIYENKKMYRVNQLRCVVSSFLSFWDKIAAFTEKSVDILLCLELLDKIICIFPDPVYMLGENHNNLKNWILNVLTYKENNWSEQKIINFIIQVVHILSCVAGPFEEENYILSNGLDVLKQNYYSATSNIPDVTKIILFNKLTEVLAISKSRTILNCIIEIYITTTCNLDNTILKKSLIQYIEYPNTEFQSNSIKTIYNMCKLNNNYKQCYKLGIDVLSTLLEYCNYKAFETYFENYIREILSFAKVKISKDNIVNKIINFILIEVLFLRINLDELENGTSVIVTTAQKELTQNNLLKELCGHLIRSSTNTISKDNEEIKEYCRLYHCHSYKALSSLISNTKKDLDVYMLLFKREENKKDVLWTNLIDPNKKYTFILEFDSVPKFKKNLVKIRNEVNQNKRKTSPYSESINYIQSQNLFESTLSEDVSKFDFTNTIIRNQSQLEEHKSDNKNFVQTEIQLESIDINNHECMATMCGLIQHMVQNNIHETPEEENPQLPHWMKVIKEILIKDNIHVNVKIFLIKVIENNSEVFKPYVKEFFHPVVKFITDKCAGTSINFFIADLITMMVKWWNNKIILTENDKQLVSDLLLFLIENAYHDRRDVYKYNLELIKLVVETWKDNLQLPRDFLYQEITQKRDDTKLSITINMIGILLANKLEPWRVNEIKPFLQALCKHLENRNTSVHQPCAETLGMALNCIQNNNDVYIHLKSLINQNFKENIQEDDKFAYCLEGIARYDPTITDDYMEKLVFKIEQMKGNFKCIYLRIFLSRIEYLCNVNSFKLLEFGLLLKDVNTDVQLLTLQLIRDCLEYFTILDLTKILESVVKFVKHPHMLCRSTMYDILILICKKVDDKNYVNLISLCKKTLTFGLVDNDLEIQEKIYDYFSNKIVLSKEILERYTWLLNNLYNQDIEEHFLGYNTYFLLNLLNEKDEFNKKLFNYPLQNCSFETYQINCHWRAQHVSLIPMFADTYKSQIDENSLSIMNPNFLRATKSTFSFTPTQTTRNDKSLYSNVSSSFAFSLNMDVKDEDNTFKNPNQIVLSSKYRKRFIKNQSEIKKQFAYREVKKISERIEMRKEKAMKKERETTIYRKYRSGDFPDVEIAFSDLLKPLQVLSKLDMEIGKIMYVSLVNNIIDKIKDKDYYINSITTSINYIFNNSSHHVSHVMSAFLDIALSQKNKMKFEPNVISNICQSSGLHSAGCLLLEEYLISYDDLPSTSKKLKGEEVIAAESYWIKLAELYREMCEWDIVKAIFVEKMNCDQDNVLEAIHAESEYDWKTAKEYYEELIQNDTSVYKKDFYYESYFKCFANLSKWDTLCDSIKQVITTNNETNVWNCLWDQDWNQQKLLPWFITAQIRIILKDESKLNSLLCEMNNCFKDSDKCEYTKTNFAEELSVLHLINDDLEIAQQITWSCVTNFLENWCNVNPLFRKIRFNNLIKLRNIVDVIVFINNYNKLSLYNYDKIINNVIKNWMETSCESLQDTIILETKVLYRTKFISMLDNKLKTITNDEDDETLFEALKNTKKKLQNNLIDMALKQNNFSVARMYVTKDSHLHVSKCFLLRANEVTDKKDKIENILKAWKFLNKESKNNLNILVASEHLFDLTQKLVKILYTDEILFQNNKQKLNEYTSNINSIEDIEMFGCKSLKNAIESCEKQNNLESLEQIGKCYVKLAYFVQNDERYEKDFIYFVLNAMKMECTEGIQLFPSILNIKKLPYDYKEDFIQQVNQIPTWLFLRWVPQLLANLNTNNIFAISNIVLKIAEEYPQAIMYPYRLSKESYVFENDEFGLFGTEITKKLDDMLLENKMVDIFLKALAYISVPEVDLLYHIKKLKKACELNSKESFDVDYKNLISELYIDVPGNDYKYKIRGKIFNEISSYKKSLDALSKKKFVSKIFLQELKEIEISLQNVLRNKEKKGKFSQKLVDYSPWIQYFYMYKHEIDLEIPGQYDGLKQPLVQYHIKIAGFSENVKVMYSIRKPIKITILGSDAKEYPFLIKYGEDLRQDQRIQQLFCLMNDIFKTDTSLSQQYLTVMTYQVVPLTCHLGMIQWVENSKELQSFISSALQNDEENNNYKKASVKYDNWLSLTKQKSYVDTYGLSLTKYNRNKTITHYRSLVNEIPWDILRRAFHNISIDCESFIALRYNFVKSYSVMCIAHWVLGIGDRHLKNSMVSLKRGEVIGIDFGHAFGTATQILPVPELVPFRLTPHILNLMQPFYEHGLFKETMIHALRALRNNHVSLMETTKVFILEPSLNWRETALQIKEECTSDEEWYPLEKILQVKRKLKGVNPVTIIIEELKTGPSIRSKYLDGYISVVKGLPEHNIRARKGNDLSIEDQVLCLIDNATDYNLLGRMWKGWEAWV